MNASAFAGAFVLSGVRFRTCPPPDLDGRSCRCIVRSRMNELGLKAPVVLNFRLTRETHEALKRVAASNYRSVGAELRMLVEAHIASQNGNGEKS